MTIKPMQLRDITVLAVMLCRKSLQIKSDSHEQFYQ